MIQQHRLGKLARLFRFDTPDADFELLETEHGEPGILGGWHDAPPEHPEPPPGPARALRENHARLMRECRGDINSDVILRTFSLGGSIDALAAFMNGMADADAINDFILRPGMQRGCMQGAGKRLAAFAVEHVFSMQEAELSDDWEEIKTAVLEGRTALFIDGDDRVILMDTRGYVSRSVSTPQNESVVLGPRESFTENIRTNVTLLRRIIKTDDFVVEFRKSGGRNNSRIAIVYREGVANETLVEEVKKRLASIDTLMVLSTGVVEQLTERHPASPLPQTLSTERPDRVAAHVMQGHVAVIVEGNPIANVMPATLFTLMASPEDAYHRQPIGTLVRVVRYIGAFLSIIVPGYFIALALHHQGMLSGEVLSTVIASRSMVFLPLPIEMLFLLLVFQLIREAGLSVPGVMGQSVGIIGGLVLGQAAVAANIVSTVSLIIVALTGLGNFTIRDYSTQLAAVYFRILLVLFGWIGGLLGVFSAVLLSTAYIASLKSYGVPFLSPVAPKTYAKGPAIARGRMGMHQKAEDYVNTGRRRV